MSCLLVTIGVSSIIDILLVGIAGSSLLTSRWILGFVQTSVTLLSSYQVTKTVVNMHFVLIDKADYEFERPEFSLFGSLRKILRLLTVQVLYDRVR